MKRSFRLHVLLRVAGLLLAMLGLMLSWEQRIYAAMLVCGIITLALTAELIRYVERGSRDLGRFLQSIKHQDHTQRFTPDGRGPVFDAQREAQNAIMDEFKRLRAEKEANHLYLQTVIKHVQIALLCVNEQGEIVLMNPAAKELLGKPYLINLDALQPSQPELAAEMKAMEPGERSLVKMVHKGEMAQLALACTDFKLQNEPFRLISLQNIRAELEAQEFEAWQRLIRVLTHEIMNSVTPIISLAQASKAMLQDGLNAEEIQDLEQSLEVIAREARVCSILCRPTAT
ncbi:MAG: PAS domain-containing protein [Bacteroidia bacterium]